MCFQVARSLQKRIQGVKIMAKLLPKEHSKHWLALGDNSIAMAVHLLQAGNIIAVPTDTIYGLAGLANDPASSLQLYKIKERSQLKPFAVCLSSVNQIGEWAVVDNIPAGMLNLILPGPVTVVLPRLPGVHEHLNPGVANVGIRVPDSEFILKITEQAGPLVLTSANVSNQPSSIKPEEFCELWPQLGGIFHKNDKKEVSVSTNRVKLGSTIVDLTMPGKYQILRYGKFAKYIIRTLREFELTPKLASVTQGEDATLLKDKQTG